MEKVPFGHFVLSLHYWGASAMIAFMAMHLLQGLLWGAYKKPRELQWVVGVLLFIMTLVLGLTGYLLPWDLNALLASRVAINISGNAPVLGQAVLQFLQDGNGIGTLTISRFFGIHVWLVPALLIGLVGMHLAIFRWNGPAGTADRRSAQAQARPVLAGAAVHGHRAVVRDVRAHRRAVVDLAGAARRESRSERRACSCRIPAWYFLALYALLDVVGKVPARDRAARDAVRDDHRADAARRAAARAAVRRPQPVAPAVAPAVGARRHGARHDRRDRAELHRPVQRRRAAARAQPHRTQRTGRRRRGEQRRAADRPGRHVEQLRQHGAGHHAGESRQRRVGVHGELRQLPRREGRRRSPARSRRWRATRS